MLISTWLKKNRRNVHLVCKQSQKLEFCQWLMQSLIRYCTADKKTYFLSKTLTKVGIGNGEGISDKTDKHISWNWKFTVGQNSYPQHRLGLKRQ